MPEDYVDSSCLAPGGDDFPPEAKAAAARDINAALEAGWSGFAIGERVPLSEIAPTHELAKHPQHSGRVVFTLYRFLSF
jgi:NADPH2:quinone reductase